MAAQGVLQPSPLTPSVANLDQIIRQCLNRLRCIAGLDILWVVAEQNRLLGFNYDDTRSALRGETHKSVSSQWKLRPAKCTASYLSAVHTPILNLSDDISLATNMYALRVCLVNSIARCVENGNRILDLRILDLECVK
jgi:hypothetical protein